MEFSGQYLTYEDYRALGGTLDLTSFNLLEFESRRQIDIRTFNRLKDIEEIPQEVKLCDYGLINSIDSFLKAKNNVSNVKSENIDGYSVQYTSSSDVQSIIKSKNEDIKDIIYSYLSNVVVNDEHLLYCGIR